MQEQVSDFFETCPRRQILDGVPAQDQLPSLPIDMAQPGRSRHNAFQAGCHRPMVVQARYIVNIDYTINMI